MFEIRISKPHILHAVAELFPATLERVCSGSDQKHPGDLEITLQDWFSISPYFHHRWSLPRRPGNNLQDWFSILIITVYQSVFHNNLSLNNHCERSKAPRRPASNSSRLVFHFSIFIRSFIHHFSFIHHCSLPRRPGSNFSRLFFDFHCIIKQ